MKKNHFAKRRVILIILVCFMSCSAVAQKVNPDTLTIDELNLYKDKAVTMRNAGMIATFSGIGIIIGGIIGASYFVPQDPSYIAGFILIFGAVGLATTIVGINLWAVGGSRKTKAELTLQKFNITPEGSMALGLGITLRF